MSALWNRSSFSLLQLIIIGVLFLSGVVGPFSVLVYQFIRHRRLLSPLPTESKHFLCPAMPLLPCVAILFNSVVMMKTHLLDIGLFVAWSLIGVIVYFSYGINHSKLVGYQEIPGGAAESTLEKKVEE